MNWLCFIKHKWKDNVLQLDWSSSKKPIVLDTGEQVKTKNGLFIPPIHMHGKICKRCYIFKVEYYSRNKLGNKELQDLKKECDEEARKKQMPKKVLSNTRRWSARLFGGKSVSIEPQYQSEYKRKEEEKKKKRR